MSIRSYIDAQINGLFSETKEPAFYPGAAPEITSPHFKINIIKNFTLILASNSNQRALK